MGELNNRYDKIYSVLADIKDYKTKMPWRRDKEELYAEIENAIEIFKQFKKEIKEN